MMLEDRPYSGLWMCAKCGHRWRRYLLRCRVCGTDSVEMVIEIAKSELNIELTPCQVNALWQMLGGKRFIMARRTGKATLERVWAAYQKWRGRV